MRRYCHEMLAGSALALLMSASAASAQTTVTYSDGDVRGPLDLPDFITSLEINSGFAIQNGLTNTLGFPLVIVSKDGAGTLTLSGDNSSIPFLTIGTGGIVVRAGTLIAGSDKAFGSALVTASNPINETVTIGYLDGVKIDNTIFIPTESQAVNFEVTSGSATQAGEIFTPLSGKFIKTGAGELLLTNAAPTNFNARVIVKEGTLAFNNAAAIGTGEITLEGGTLRSAPGAGGTINVLNDIVLGDSPFDGAGDAVNAGISAATGTTLSLQGDFDILATDAVITFGSTEDQGTILFDMFPLAFDETAQYVVAGGTLANANGLLTGLLVTGASTTVDAGATLDMGTEPSGIRNLKGAGNVVISDDDIFGFPALELLVDPNTSSDFAGVISGPGSIEVVTTPFIPGPDPGRMILSGNNTYAGNTYVCDCTELQIGNGGTIGTLGAGDVFNGGTLIFNRSNTYVVNNTILDNLGLPGKVVQGGTGMVVLTATNTYTGGTTINRGTLQLGNGGTTGSIVGNVLDNGALAFNRSDSYTFAGVISGSGAVVQAGTGTVILTGANTYTGGTTVSAGTLREGVAGAFVNNTAYTVNGGTLDLNGFDLTTSSLSGTGGGVALGSADLTLDQAANTSFAGAINGTGSLVKDGGGIFTLTGDSTYTGPTTVNEGTLAVDGSIVSPVTVNGGGILAGTGSVGATILTSGGTIAPGHSPGTLTVVGSIAFGAGSTYAVEVDGPTSDLIAVTAGGGGAGTANLSGGAVAASFLSTGNLLARYTILTAAGGLGGTTFAGLTDNQPAIETSLSYDANNAHLDVKVALDQLPGLTLNQKAVATTLTNYFNTNGTLPLAFATLDANGLTLASGEIATAGIQAGFIATDRFLDEISSRFVHSGGDGVGPAPQKPAAYAAANVATPTVAAGAYAALMDRRATHALAAGGGWKAWGSAYGLTADMDGDPAYVGSHDLNIDLWGLAAGAGWRDGNTAFGAALGGGHSDFDLDGGLGSGDAGTFNAGIYGLAEFGEAYLSGALAYGYHDVSTSRSLFGETLEANYGAHSFSGRAEAGYRFDTAFAGVTPYAAFQGTALSIPDYAETSAGAFALAYDGQTASTARGELGLRLDKTIALETALLKLSGRAAWAHSSTDNSFNAAFVALPGTSFTVIGADAPEDSALVDFGAALAFDNGVSAGLAFQGQFGDGFSSYSGSARVSIRW